MTRSGVTRLALVETDAAGKVSAVVRDIEDCTSEEWDEIVRRTQENAEKARLFTNNEAKMNLILQGLASAGLFRENQLNLYPVLKPYFDTLIAEHEEKKGWAKKLDTWKRNQRNKVFRWLFDVAGKIVTALLNPKK
ncbi:hypothetical protein BWI97_14325 [Siphonobacter sp. BAB-5405]|uniref:hypothetical protein n=1 Tax=Siphonobacter sp. BAB-5405 TaxID=1864825 RepID=UPI000C7FF85A|nr:hypothetical protein [Siphonobacter sp. BAB-5405]PMD95528.1 hypothetical protein BWI97_14325 [Siphonobacter sp. BAB-5405]